MQKTLRFVTVIVFVFALARPAGSGQDTLAMTEIRRSVLKIYATFQHENYAMPWQGSIPSQGTGTGFVIAGRRILTNAHVVSDARFIQVQRDGDATRYAAAVTFFGHDCDLAILTVEDDSFFDGTTPMEMADALPELNDEVTVLGYPMGGTRLSVTRGVVSRIDYSVYSHSAVDQHLVLQVDAAINPGNSGGPVLFNGKVVGLAFQGLSWGENIGYAIPRPVMLHFLNDIQDGKYDGYPELGAGFLDTRNSALRTALKLPQDGTGVVVYYVDPFGSAKGHILAGDVLLSIDNHPIASDGTINLNGNNVIFAELLERKQWGESISFSVWRNGAEQKLDIPLTNPVDPFIYRNLYNMRPRYFISGGLVFSPLTQPYLRVAANGPASANSHQLTYYSQYAKIDGLYEGLDEFVVLTARLPHAVNTYAVEFLNGIVTEVNGAAIHRLSDVKKAMAAPRDGFHVVKFAGIDDSLVLDAVATEKANPEIFTSYGVSEPEYMGDAE